MSNEINYFYVYYFNPKLVHLDNVQLVFICLSTLWILIAGINPIKYKVVIDILGENIQCDY